MRNRFYVDTSVWRDYFEDRKDGLRPLGEFAFEFLKKCKREKSKIIVSDVVFEELSLEFSKTQQEMLLSEFEELIIRVLHSRKQEQEAFSLLRKFNRAFPLADVLHSVIARDESAVLVSRDFHFKQIGLVDVFLPEELL